MRFFTDTISIYGFKLVTDGKTPKTRNSTALYSGVMCSIQPAGTDIFTLFPEGIEVARAYVVFIPDTTIVIKNGFQLVDQLGNKYVVRGVPEVWTTANSRTNHIKVAVEKKVDY